MLSHADDRIGEVLDALDRLEIADDTLVIFSSDNGPARGSRGAELGLMHDTATGAGYNIAAARGISSGRKGYKSALFEGGKGVPFIARWPGRIAAGQIDRDSMISAVDLLPTFCATAVVQLPTGYQPDGVNQMDTLMGRKAPIREKPLYWKMASAWPIPESRPYHWVSYATVDRNWKLLANDDLSYLELYDLVADPLENRDMKTSRPEVVAELSAKIRSWQSELPEKPTGDVFSAERAELE